jgi:uncharacterized protein YbjT (DUF2867 family)
MDWWIDGLPFFITPTIHQSTNPSLHYSVNVLVTGGTGFVGREIVRELQRAGHRIHLLVRDARSREAGELAAKCGAQLRSGNVLDAASITDSFGGIDAVIHLVGIISEIGDQTFENVHARGTQKLVASAQQAGVRRLVHMSALGTRPNATARYHQSKWAAEEIVRHSGLDWTIFRPSIVYGPGDGFVNLFARISRWSPIVPIVGGGRTKFQPVPVASVAAAFVAALAEPRAVGRTYDLCGRETFTLDEIVDEILAMTNRRRWKFHVPRALAAFQAALLEFVCRNFLGQAPPLNRDQLIMLREDNVGDGRPAEELFGLPTESFREGIRRYIR